MPYSWPVPPRPEEAIEFFRGKVAMTDEQFAALAAEVRTMAFTVAGIASLDALQFLADLITRALEEGLTLQEFQESANTELERRGFEGLSPHRADNVFRTNMQTAFSAGRYKQMTAPEVLLNRPYWQYDAVQDERTRPTHAALDGRVWRADDPLLGHLVPAKRVSCRCGVISLSEEQVRRMGLQPESGAPDWVERPDGLPQPLLPDPGFAHNPGKVAWKPDLSKYPPDLRAAYEQRLKSV